MRRLWLNVLYATAVAVIAKLASARSTRYPTNKMVYMRNGTVERTVEVQGVESCHGRTLHIML